MTIDITFAIVSLIKQSAEITAIVGTNVFSDRTPQGTNGSSICLWVRYENALDTLNGPLGMDQPIMRFECYADRRIDASNLRLLLRDYLAGYAGKVGDVHIKGIAQQVGQEHETHRVRIGTDQYQFVARQDLRVTYDSIPPVGV